jgi:hypothetical protein
MCQRKDAVALPSTKNKGEAQVGAKEIKSNQGVPSISTDQG